VAQKNSRLTVIAPRQGFPSDRRSNRTFSAIPINHCLGQVMNQPSFGHHQEAGFVWVVLAVLISRQPAFKPMMRLYKAVANFPAEKEVACALPSQRAWIWRCTTPFATQTNRRRTPPKTEVQ
jgi:hypothetical protein